MSKILERGETGFGILIERDGYITKDMNKNIFLNENFEIKPDEPVIINCVLQKWGVENKNGRIYPKEILTPQIEEYRKLVETNSAISEADHPDSSVVSLHNVSHIIKKMWWGQGSEENVLYGQLEIITSPAYMRDGIVTMVGDKIVEYLKRGIKLGISSRGVGTLKEVHGKNIVQADFELICFDLVGTPSTPGAYLFPNKNELQVGENNKLGDENSEILSEDKKLLVNNLDKFLLS